MGHNWAVLMVGCLAEKTAFGLVALMVVSTDKSSAEKLVYYLVCLTAVLLVEMLVDCSASKLVECLVSARAEMTAAVTVDCLDE